MRTAGRRRGVAEVGAGELIGPHDKKEGSLEPRRHDRVPFAFAKQVAEFNRANIADVSEALRRAQESLILPENMLRFEHGNAWRSKPMQFSDEKGELELHSSEHSIQFSDIVEHRLSLFETFKNELVAAMMTQFTHSIYEKLSAGAERVGNTMEIKATDNFAEKFLAMVESITFSVDRNGQVSMPQLHAGEEAFSRFQRDLTAVPAELKQRIEEAIARKSKEAIDAEALRIAKFRVRKN